MLCVLDDIEDLFRRHARSELSLTENEKLQDIIEILYRPEHFSTESLENARESRAVRAFFSCIIIMVSVCQYF